MKKLDWLDSNISKIISLFEYELYIVKVDTTIDCSCKNFTTKQGDPRHKLCLGTGQKIKIKKIKAASENTSSSFKNTDTSESGTGFIYYIRNEYGVKEQDILVNEDDVHIIHRVEQKQGTNKDKVYRKCVGINKKTDSKVFLKNFRELLRGDHS